MSELALAVCLCLAPFASADAACGTAREAATLVRALKLVPNGQALNVKAIDPELTGGPGTIQKLDAFIVREPDGSIRQVVYLNCESPLFRAAVGGSEFYVQVLAGVIHHEASHLQGLDERQAARAEREFFQELIRKRLVPEEEGLAYLKLMEHARDMR